MRLILIGIPQSRRSMLLHAAAAGWPSIQIVEVAWLDLLEGRADLRSIVHDGDIVRLDSPGRDFETEVALLRLGREFVIDRGAAAPTLFEIDGLQFDRGQILWPAAWHAGFSRALEMIAGQLAQCPAHRLTRCVQDVGVAFDKTATHARLAPCGVRVAPAIGRVHSFDDLVDRARSLRWSQVFLKLAYGSSASGAVALRIGRDKMQAWTTTEIESNASGTRLYNTRAVRLLESVGEIRRVVDALCPHVVHVERWLPKAGIDGKTFDLRVVTIAGQPMHTVVRMSRSPMTNLHLLNQRGDVDRVRERCGLQAWNSMLDTARLAAQAFAGCHCLGLDVMFDVSMRKHTVIEVNAFGDLLPGVVVNGMDTYAAQLASLVGPPDRAAAEEAA